MEDDDKLQKDEVRLIVTNLEDEPIYEDVPNEDDFAEVHQVDMDAAIPMAVVAEKDSTRSERSGWRLFSSEDLPQLTLREILGGDYLLGGVLRRNIWFVLLLVLLGILYISNRYAAQQEIIEEEELRKELIEKKNYALTQYAELTMHSRQSSIERQLQRFGDSLLTTPKEPPFIIKQKQME